MRLTRKTGMVVTAAVLVVGAGAGAALASGAGDRERPITGRDLDKASQAALTETGGSEVTETEVGDEESFYEVEVTMPDGSQVDVQLDEDFDVVGSETDSDEAQDDDETADGS